MKLGVKIWGRRSAGRRGRDIRMIENPQYFLSDDEELLNKDSERQHEYTIHLSGIAPSTTTRKKSWNGACFAARVLVEEKYRSNMMFQTK